MGKLWMIGLVLLTVIQECAKDALGPDEGVPAEIVGTWYATSFTFVNKNNTSESADLVRMGINFTITMNEDGTYSTSMTSAVPGFVPESNTGTMTVAGNLVTATEDGETFTLTYILAGGILTFTQQDESFDFNDDGVDEPAILTIVLTQTQPGSTASVPAEAVGTWNATSYIYTNPADTSQHSDLVSAGGSFSLTIMANGGFLSTFTDTDGTQYADAGLLSFSGDQVMATGTSETELITWSISGNVMTLLFTDPFDFDGNGVDEQAAITVVLTKS